MAIPSDPHLRRWMLFVDGENFVIQAQNYAKEFGFTLTEGDFYECKCLSGFQVILQHKN